MEAEYKVSFSWDSEACVWMATSADVEGLVLESESLDCLVERVRHAIPELLALDGVSCDNASLVFGMSRKERLISVG